ncbi:MAG TPA: Gfo/Idh/MocA family oxidoreductase [Sphingomonadaceae bacterium]|nr:Gfo/Idh/MocA family oxidoreductase [Sphingomonadaceae bacterium]
MTPIGIIGFGKISADQHAPAIAGGGRFELVAATNRSPLTLDGVATYQDHAQMLRETPMDAVAVNTPPGPRYQLARDCLQAGKHVMLEKPPGVTLGEVEALARLAAERGVTLMTTWHAQENDAVLAAAELMRAGPIAGIDVFWHEDVRKWHPGQAWIWEPGGFGVFDPGINALSILTRIVPGALIVRGAKLAVPANKAMPIAVELEMASPAVTGAIAASFDFRYTQGERWTIEAVMASGQRVLLSDGGARLSVDGTERVAPDDSGEYPRLYARFAELIAAGRSHVDLEPLRVVADAFMMGAREEVEAFQE